MSAATAVCLTLAGCEETFSVTNEALRLPDVRQSTGPHDPAARADPATPALAGPAATTSTNANCTLIVPRAPLSAAGLATPYRLVATDPRAGACHEINPDQSAFVEATILDPASGALSVYHPLVVDDRAQPAIAPAPPRLPARAVVGVWFGFQADTLRLRRKRANRHHLTLRFNAGDGCVNGAPGSPFGQFAYCNAPRFFAAAESARRAGKLQIPALGTAKDGRPCPSTRDFSVVDQDQSDNLPTKYLGLSDGRTAQFSAANQARLTGSTVLTNASDNGLLNNRIAPALGCRSFTAPDLSADGAQSASLALNELHAAAGQRAPIALIPPNDPMALVNDKPSVLKTNLYRAGAGQPPLNQATDTGVAYCTNLEKVGAPRLALDKQYTSAAPSPDPAAATLFDFLSQRLTGSWSDLGCQALTGHGPPTIGAAPAATDPGTVPSSAALAPAAPAADPAAPADPAVAGPARAADPAGNPAPAPLVTPTTAPTPAARSLTGASTSAPAPSSANPIDRTAPASGIPGTG
ncbi:MAG TPA: hypothetical protein VL595_29630 [Pseudonocardia sp.]|nr:hypothetical protein [Pseudonocardia sp.]